MGGVAAIAVSVKKPCQALMVHLSLSPNRARVLRHAILETRQCIQRHPSVLGAAGAVECREAARGNVGYVLAVGGSLPVFAQWDERHVFPQPLLQFGAEPLLLAQICRCQPGGAQLLNVRAAGPTIDGLLAVGADREVAERMDVRQ